MDRRNPPAAGGAGDRRDRRPESPPAEADHSSRKPAVLGIVVAVGAVGAWLLRRERRRPPEGTWRDLLSSENTGGGKR